MKITIIIQLSATKHMKEIKVETHTLNTFSCSPFTLNCLHTTLYISSALWLRTEAYEPHFWPGLGFFIKGTDFIKRCCYRVRIQTQPKVRKAAPGSCGCRHP